MKPCTKFLCGTWDMGMTYFIEHRCKMITLIILKNCISVLYGQCLPAPPPWTEFTILNVPSVPLFVFAYFMETVFFNINHPDIKPNCFISIWMVLSFYTRSAAVSRSPVFIGIQQNLILKLYTFSSNWCMILVLV